MKNLTTLIAIALMITVCGSSYATIRYVNNYQPYPTGPASMHYTSFGNAHSASVSGDSIFIQGSPVNYGNMSISKSITIIGPGFNTTSYNGHEAVFANVYCNSPSVKLIGIKAGIIYYYPGANNVLIKRCEALMIAGANSPSVGYLTVEECFLTGFVDGNYLIAFRNYDGTSGQLTNLVFRNNVVNGTIRDFNGVSAATCVLSNNVFVRKGSGLFESLIENVQNATFINNIFLSTYGAGNFNGVTSCLFSNNIIWGTAQTFPSGPGPNYNQNPVMVNQPPGAGSVTYTHDLHLTAGSPVEARGLVDSIPNTQDDIGIYGGTDFFTMTGNPPIPIIHQLQITNSVVSGGTPLNINFISRRKQ